MLLAVACPAAVAEPFTIEATGSKRTLGKVRAIGDFRPQADPTLGAATSVFGPPTRVVRTSDVSCRVVYAGVGLRFAFVNLGGGGGCDPALTKSQVARAFDPRWHTGKGLSIGDRLRRLKRLYPAATRHGRSWWIVKGPTSSDQVRPVRRRARDYEGRARPVVCHVDRRGGRMTPR